MHEIICLIRNSIKDEYGREIIGLARGTCKCGRPFAALIVKDLDDGLNCYSAWCRECDLRTVKRDVNEKPPVGG